MDRADIFRIHAGAVLIDRRLDRQMQPPVFVGRRVDVLLDEEATHSLFDEILFHEAHGAMRLPVEAARAEDEQRLELLRRNRVAQRVQPRPAVAVTADRQIVEHQVGRNESPFAYRDLE